MPPDDLAGIRIGQALRRWPTEPSRSPLFGLFDIDRLLVIETLPYFLLTPYLGEVPVGNVFSGDTLTVAYISVDLADDMPCSVCP